MPNPTESLLEAFDGHCVEDVRTSLAAGADAVSPIRGKAPIYWLLEQYVRSDRLVDCIRLLLAHGATVVEPGMLPVILNDGDGVKKAIAADRSVLESRLTLVSTFTPMTGVTLLHVAAEYGHLEAAKALLEAGADLNARAEFDEFGLNGHTPIFHTVNSNRNRSEPLMQLLLSAGAKADLPIAGLHWGQGFEWETTFFDITPISYAQLGMLPQVHREERDIDANVRRLLNAAGRKVPPMPNVPNRYLKKK